jgi:hypothetical protein
MEMLVGRNGIHRLPKWPLEEVSNHLVDFGNSGKLLFDRARKMVVVVGVEFDSWGMFLLVQQHIGSLAQIRFR